MKTVEARYREPEYLAPDVHARIRALDAARYPDGVAHFPDGDVLVQMGHLGATHVDRSLDAMELYRLEDGRKTYDMEGWLGGGSEFAEARDQERAMRVARPPIA